MQSQKAISLAARRTSGETGSSPFGRANGNNDCPPRLSGARGGGDGGAKGRERVRKGAEGRANRRGRGGEVREGVARCGRRRVAALIPFFAGLVCLADLALLILIDPKLTLTDSN